MAALRTLVGDTERKYEADLFIEGSKRYIRKDLAVYNTTGSDITIADPIGYPLKYASTKHQPIVAGEESSVVAIIATTSTDNIVIAAGESMTIPCYVRGPAILAIEGIPTVDYDGDDLDVDAIETALLAVSPPILLQDGPAITSTGTR